MNDREYQINNLQRIVSMASMAPFFKQNPKFPIEGSPRIAYDDILAKKLIIRCDDNIQESGGYWIGKDAPIVAEYESIEELVDDEWRLD